MRKALTVLVVVVALVVSVSSCSALTDRESAAAVRLEAEAALERARADAAAERAQAEADKMRAETAAAAERSAVRRSEADAALTRWLVLLPVLALTFGVVLAGVVAVVALTRRGGSMAMDPVVVTLLQVQERRLAELERGVWHSIAQGQRGRLTRSVGEEVLVVDIPEDGAVR